MADEIETQLRSLMEKAPLTPTPEEEAAASVEREQQQHESAAQSDQQQPQQDKPADQAQGAADANKDKPNDYEELKQRVDHLAKRENDLKGMGDSERQKRRAAEAKAEQAAAQAAQMQAQLQQLLALVQQGKADTPDAEQDVVGAVKALEKKLADAQAQQQQFAQRQAELTRQNQIAATIQHKVEDFETEFKESHADYDEALDYVLDSKEREFELAGYPKENAQKAAAQWAMNAAAMMLRSGRNPAEQCYAFAKSIGFQPKAQQQAANGAATQQPDAAAQAAAKAAEDAAAKIQQLKDGQAATSKMAGGGTGASQDGSLKSGVALQGAAFDSWSEKFLRQMTRG